MSGASRDGPSSRSATAIRPRVRNDAPGSDAGGAKPREALRRLHPQVDYRGARSGFTSLDAQRESGISYIQRQPGWILLSDRYDDGGFTGANTDRPAFQRLLLDIEAHRIDVVVVYKVDRLSRSLLDFVGVMGRFNAAGVEFVSVTQNFSTADAMGRLTLNMLMSFAEFEREMISERTRDKIAASRRKGQWTGGPVPLGYTVENKKLVVDELEAILVREIFATYLEVRSVLGVARALKERQRVTKRHHAANGSVREVRAWTTNDVARVLKNPIYAGYMAAGGELHEGEHSAIVERAVFARTQALLAAERKTKPSPTATRITSCAACFSARVAAAPSRRRRPPDADGIPILSL